MPFLNRPNAQVFYEVEGEPTAPAVTLLNGYGRSSTDFRAMSRHLAGNGYRVLRLDNRGAGQTQNEPGFQVGDMVSDVVALWDALEIAQSHLLGISYGGVLSILASAQHPTRVQSLSLVSTTPSSFFVTVDNNLSAQSAEEVEKSLSRYFSPQFAQANPILFRSLVKETAKAFSIPELRVRSAQQRSALGKFDFTALLHSIRCPVLILHGEADAVISPDAADVMHRAISQSQLELLPEVGHLLLAENPKFFYERVTRFLNTAH